MNVGKTKMMVSGTEGEIVLSKIDPIGIRGKRVAPNAECCTHCTKWIHGREMHENEKGNLQFCKTFCL